MVAPATYYGYDDNQNCIVSGTAEDASKYINPEEVQSAIEYLQQVLEEQMNKIANNLAKISETTGQAIIIQGAKMTDVIEEAAVQIKQLPTQLMSNIEPLMSDAEKARDTIQNSCNDTVYKSVASYSGVVSVK